MDLSILIRYWGCVSAVLAACCSMAGALEVPTGTLLEIRLQQEVNSYSSRSGDAIQGILIAPVVVNGQIIIPAGTIAQGVVQSVRRVGFGLIRESAAMDLRFSSLVLSTGRTLPITASLIEVENAREQVDAQGRIRGIRSTSTPGYRASALLTSFAAVDPIALAFSTAGFASLLRFSEPEMRFEPGTELLLRTTSPFFAEPSAAPITRTVAITDQERHELRGLVQTMPFRTRTAASNQESDLTNLIFIGDQGAIERAFAAAGWRQPDALTAAARYRTLRSLAEHQEYAEAPMSTLLLDGNQPAVSLAKSQNTFSKRHHLRIFARPELWAGRQVFTAAATHDVGLGFTAQRNVFIHVIDQQIDNERAKVVNDLLFTGCVNAAEMMERPWLPEEAGNATGQPLFTDRAVAILHFSDCDSPRDSRETVQEPPGPYRGNRAMRISRQTLLVLRNDLYRGNIVYQGVSAAILFQQYLRNRNRTRSERPERELALEAQPDTDIDVPVAGFLPRRPARGPTLSSPKLPKPSINAAPHEWAPPMVELGFHFGGLFFSRSTIGAEGLLITRLMPDGHRKEFMLSAGNHIDPGISLGGTVTLNSRRRVSNEFGFELQRGEFQLDLKAIRSDGTPVAGHIEEQRSGLIVRQFTYSTLFHLKPRESRIRPYFAAGPSLQLLHLSNSPFQKAEGMFRFSLHNVGMIRAAYSFGRVAPLEGGGIFRPGIQMGGGLKVRISPHWMLRLDCRNTLSRRPDLLKKSVLTLIGSEPGEAENQVESLPSFGRGRLVQHRVTAGLSFTF